MEKYFVSKGKGQHFKREGSYVTIVCQYDFNPSIERNKYDDKLISALECIPCTKQEYEAAVEKVLVMLDIALVAA